MSIALFGPIDQIGYLVDDLEHSIERWIGRFGVGPWTVFRNVRLDGRHRGELVRVTMDVALAYQGDIQIELIKVTNDAASPYRTEAGQPILGIHHVAWVVDDIDVAVSRLTAKGLKVAFDAGNQTTRVAYLEDEDEPGVLYEVIQGTGMRELIHQGVAATRAWDGSNPIQTIEAAV
jgi:methylmalonyl-CoA/ethylmalonyl-CoA epimerase